MNTNTHTAHSKAKYLLQLIRANTGRFSYSDICEKDTVLKSKEENALKRRSVINRLNKVARNEKSTDMSLATMDRIERAVNELISERKGLKPEPIL